MLDIPCGVCGVVRVVKQNSLTKCVTGDFSFQNIWTDAGLAHLNSDLSRSLGFPNRILWGSGVHSEPFNSVTSLKQYIGHGNVSYSSNGAAGSIEVVGDICTLTITKQVVQQARGVSWTIAELALGYNELTTFTYTRPKNLDGFPISIPVSAIEIVTIYYTMQFQYPMTLPPQPVVGGGGLPENTTATFTLRPDKQYFGYSNPAYYAGSPIQRASAYTNKDFAGRIDPTELRGKKLVFGIDRANNIPLAFFGNEYGGAVHMWKIDPPITKNNTQELELECSMTFSNAAPIEIP